MSITLLQHRSRRKRVKFVGAVIGGAAVVTLSALAVSTPGSDANSVAVGSSSMSTGVTTSQTSAPKTLGAPMAAPSILATPNWGQPSEP
jgi:hypothetical protein